MDDTGWTECRIDFYALQKINQVIDLLPSADRWCKGTLYDTMGRRCIIGAIWSIHGGRVLYEPIRQAIQEVTGRRFVNIPKFNDHRSTTYPKVMAVLHRAKQDILNGTVGQPVKQRSWIRRLFGA